MLAADPRNGSAPTRVARKRFATACGAGGVPAFAVFGWFLTAARADLLQASAFANFYDLQARALLHGRWNVPNGSLLFEGIIRDGKTYEYYGPVPALLRMPILLLTHAFDGRLTQLSMLVAYAVGLGGASWLLWLVRGVVRPGAVLGRGEWWVVAGWTFTVGCGSAMLFPASLPIVYHEAELWGAALALVAFATVIRYGLRPTPPRLATACALSTFAILSRPSVGLGPTAALGFVALGIVAVRSWTGGDLLARMRAAIPAAIAAVVPVACYVAVNSAKFATPFSTPLDKQIFSGLNANRHAVLLANGGSLFDVRYLATTVVQYVRPDALRVWHLFPFLDFTTWRAPVLLGARFDSLDRSASITATMPGLVVLAIVALIAVSRGRLRGAGLGALGAAVMGAGVGVLPTLMIGFIANRYLLDFLPLLLIPACIGLQVLLAGGRRAGSRLPLAGTAVVMLLAFGVWANLAVTLTYGRLYAPPDRVVRRGFIAFQESIGSTVETGGYRVVRPRRLGHPRPDTLADVGRCAGLYWANGNDIWDVVELGARGVQIRLRLPSKSVTAAPTVLVGLGAGGRTYSVTIRQTSSARWEVGTRSSNGPAQRGEPFGAPATTAVDVVVLLDRQLRTVGIDVDGKRVFSAADQAIPRYGVVHTAPSARVRATTTPLCDDLRP